jgi:tetratricopeptide (TPR) repeat protein
MKKTKIIFVFSMILYSAVCYSQKTKDDSIAFLSLGNVGLDKLNDVEEKKKFLEAVYLEKQKIQDYVLKRIIDNAYELYRQGDYEGAKTIAQKVLSIDPSFEEARIIANVSGSSEKSKSISIDEQLSETLSLYQKGEILEAYKRMGVIVKLSPSNEKAKYWYKKIEGDLKNYYLLKADESYKSGDKKKALSFYYKALEYSPKDEEILSNITKLENEIRDETVGAKLKEALDLYASGKLEDSYDVMKKALIINPNDEKMQKLFKELRGEIETKYIQDGNSYYKKKNYNEAIKLYTKAMQYSENPAKIEKYINNVKMTMKKEEELKKKREEERRRKEEERKKKEEEAKKNKEKQAAEQGSESAGNKADKEKEIITQQNRQAAQQHYLEGIKYLQAGDYQKAKDEFTIAKKLDPENADVDAALKRIDQILKGGQ